MQFYTYIFAIPRLLIQTKVFLIKTFIEVNTALVCFITFSSNFHF